MRAKIHHRRQKETSISENGQVIGMMAAEWSSIDSSGPSLVYTSDTRDHEDDLDAFRGKRSNHHGSSPEVSPPPSPSPLPPPPYDPECFWKCRSRRIEGPPSH